MSEQENKRYTIARFPRLPADGLMAKAHVMTMGAALVYTPDDCFVARVDGTLLKVPAGKEEQAVDLSRAYEIRLFGPDAELRWTRDGDKGEAILLASGHVPGSDDWTRKEALEVLPRTYRLWGAPPTVDIKVPDGWSALTSGRIGTLYVPCDRPGELMLEAQEYVVRDEKSGNAVVLFERLVGFEAAVDDER
jgi:CRISPR-associated protein (TIGR03984 family)